ncbi:YheC/YheD family protein [Hazenella sp. IB182357]|uniref:YheC/YheD family protein n=1 Tax=Polycladospora coralii TaxID=2771432 RepID=A0A926RY24_9BACL|nr:YheC/YheD family protein [Polycladospora coralii]MBD1373096.1 YheC/YheD family protein [Polycladospora coralii]MBS7529559.1 YheC/YheD family protein [Polycladospora coralii]
MKLPRAGWLSLNPNRKGAAFEFVPLKRFQHQKNTFPGMIIPVTLGHHTPACVTVSRVKNKAPSPHFIPTRIKVNAKNKISLGPFVAILTSDGGSPFRGNHINFADIIRTGRKMGVTVFVITPHSILSAKENIKGYLLDHQTKLIKWKPAILPLPDVVYNRIPNRRAEQTAVAQKAIKTLQQVKQIPIYNYSFFNKWALYRELSQSEELKSFLPKTTLLTGQQNLEDLLKDYSILYLKPVEGKAGIGMMRLIRLNNGYHLAHQSSKQKKHYRKKNLAEVWSAIQKLTHDRPYIAQEGVQLATYHNQPFDIRMLLQKNGNGKWERSGTGIRIAGETAISTHVPMGGRIEDVQTVFQHAFPEDKEQILKNLEETGILFAQTIESNQNTILGEISIDFGVEKNGDIWFFEANSKPMKFDEPAIRQKSLQRIIQYSLYLSGYEQSIEEVTS